MICLLSVLKDTDVISPLCPLKRLIRFAAATSQRSITPAGPAARKCLPSLLKARAFTQSASSPNEKC